MTDLEAVDTTTEAAPQRALMPAASAGLVDQQQREAGISALARMTEAEFVERLRALQLGLDRFRLMMAETLTTGEHAGADLMVIKGIEKPVFTLSGAEKTAFIARLVPTYLFERLNGSPPESPAIVYIVRTQLHLGNADGPVIAEGVGSCNSHETKYRWRYAEKSCPGCGVVGSLLLSKHNAKPGTPFAGTKPFFCWSKKGGCGKEFAADDPRITAQPRGMVENAEPFDLDNTLLKMGKKRSFVDAVKTATCASGLVTQDLEESAPGGGSTATELRDQIMTRARKLKWTTLGEIFAAVSAATGKVIKLRPDFDKLPIADLIKTLEKMPVPKDEADAEAAKPIEPGTEAGDFMDDEPSGGPA